MTELSRFERVAIDQSLCIGCGACIEVCPENALEFDDNMKSRLIWERCRDHFLCVNVCPTGAIKRVSESDAKVLSTKGWYRIGRVLSEEEKRALEEWRARYNVTAEPVL
ncbi:MAG: 4Fe-4S binding protein [Acidilobaceae archaeon]